MSEDLEIGDDPTLLTMMEEDGEASSEEQMPTIAEGSKGLGGGAESEGSKIDASKNEEDEGCDIWWWLAYSCNKPWK